MGKMTEIEKCEAKLKCLRMVEGTGLKWWEVVRFRGGVVTEPLAFDVITSDYTFALGVLEGKPVWPGDVLYREDGIFAEASTLMNPSSGRWSWAPPKPKTVMVEITRADAVRFIAYTRHTPRDSLPAAARIAEACRKALEAQ